MLAQFNVELDNLFNEKYLIPELLKYYQIPMIINVEPVGRYNRVSEEFKCYHGNQLIKTISFPSPLIINNFTINNNKLWLLTPKSFLLYDFTTNKFVLLDNKHRQCVESDFLNENNFLVLKCVNDTEIWDTVNEKLVKIVNRGMFTPYTANSLLLGNLIINDYYNGILSILDFDEKILKYVLASDQKGQINILLYHDKIVYSSPNDEILEIYNFDNELLTIVNVCIDRNDGYSIKFHNDNFYICKNNTINVRDFDNFDIEGVSYIIGVYNHLIYYNDYNNTVVIFNIYDKTKILLQKLGKSDILP